MIHSKAVKPRIYPLNGNITPAQIDRAQEIGGDFSPNREKVNEIGREGAVGYRKQTSTMNYTLRQNEYGNIATYRHMANLTSGKVELDDFTTGKSDMSSYLTDDSGAFRGTVMMPNCRVSGFSFNIGDPDAKAERNFSLVGEQYIIMPEHYYEFQTATYSASGSGTLNMTLTPTPVEFEAGKYVMRVLRVRAGVTTEIEEGTGSDTYAFTPPASLAITNCITGDIVKVYYEAATTNETIWVDNDSDVASISANSCDIYIKVGVGAAAKMYRLQSVGVDVTFDRADYKEIGNSKVVQSGIKTKTVTVALGRLLEDFTIEEILAGNPSYPYVDASKLSDNISIIAKVYADETKATFKMGFKIENLTPTRLASTTPVEDYSTADTTLEGDMMTISDVEGDLA